MVLEFTSGQMEEYMKASILKITDMETVYSLGPMEESMMDLGKEERCMGKEVILIQMGLKQGEFGLKVKGH
jgi:hypothetical protein